MRGDMWNDSLLAVVMGLALSLVIGAIIIPVLRGSSLQKGVREDVPVGHRKKEGTPTMGGLVFLLATIIVSLIIAPLREVWILAACFVGFSALGFCDDWHKGQGGPGLKARHKLLGQVFLALALAVCLGYSGWRFALAVLFMVGFSNAINLTDGLDGLASGLSLIAAVGLGIIAVAQTDHGGIAVFCFVLAGALGGFMAFNVHPARVFMGDTGSLGLGAALALAAVMADTAMFALGLMAVFALEVGSVVIQVIYFQATKRFIGEGRRIFLRTPVHHSFELRGWSEWKIVGSFWLVGLLMAVGSGWAWFVAR